MPFQQLTGQSFLTAFRLAGIAGMHWQYAFQQKVMEDIEQWMPVAGHQRGVLPGNIKVKTIVPGVFASGATTHVHEWHAVRRWCFTEWGQPSLGDGGPDDLPLRGWASDFRGRYIFVHDPDHAFAFKMVWG